MSHSEPEQQPAGAATADKLLHEATRILANESLRNDETVRQQFYAKVNRSERPTSGKQEQWTYGMAVIQDCIPCLIPNAAVDLHNASIAAEREKVQPLMDALIFIRDNANEGVLKSVAIDTLAKHGR